MPQLSKKTFTIVGGGRFIFACEKLSDIFVALYAPPMAIIPIQTPEPSAGGKLYAFATCNGVKKVSVG